MPSPTTATAPSKTRRWRRVLIAVAVVVLALAGLLAATGFFDRDPMHVYEAQGPRSSVGALFFSGDLGLRFGMGAATTQALAAHGIETVGFNSPTLFGTRQTRVQTDAIIAQAVRQGLARLGTERIVLIGQSYGADVLQTGLAALPADLRRHVAAVILVVPGETVYLRADPSGLAYRGTPDSRADTTANLIDWTPLTCIYGKQETDSLCPQIRLPNARIVGMPGGHFLSHDADGLTANVLRAVALAARG
ncbi:AcvB/VirJ family lysyl-phosphatidylglycerol hydrolase [Sphingomonas mollis]|uniref:Bacterial virulence domain-containing protein n=1 Tax=Sphingomonas mollis TaxID=2795726 RepID=A0ABS0XLK1_9SPHN|nr:AcvB/VirJ family lysyl-phosphatidylglycerol hydrolase [Sphingomonas sp. BT553]MBJ6120911.1 hypothetical protein [Sphingomonas sp. BT553]